jgi:hypothetical protein
VHQTNAPSNKVVRKNFSPRKPFKRISHQGNRSRKYNNLFCRATTGFAGYAVVLRLPLPLMHTCLPHSLLFAQSKAGSRDIWGAFQYVSVEKQKEAIVVSS